MRRLCLGCQADWIEVGESLCQMCQIEHVRQREALATIRGIISRESVDWWGPTSRTINPEDIESGFSIIG